MSNRVTSPERPEPSQRAHPLASCATVGSSNGSGNLARSSASSRGFGGREVRQVGQSAGMRWLLSDPVQVVEQKLAVGAVVHQLANQAHPAIGCVDLGEHLDAPAGELERGFRDPGILDLLHDQELGWEAHQRKQAGPHLVRIARGDHVDTPAFLTPHPQHVAVARDDDDATLCLGEQPSGNQTK